jgi:hypothetical protein
MDRLSKLGSNADQVARTASHTSADSSAGLADDRAAAITGLI